MRFCSLFALIAVMALASVASAELPAGVAVTRGVKYASQGDKPLLMDVYLPPDSAPQPLPVIIHLAPGRGTPGRTAEQLLAKGYALLYVGYLSDDADKLVAFSRFPNDLHAAQAALAFAANNAAKYHFDSDRIGLWGDGHGATIAALLAVTSDQKELYGKLGDTPYAGTTVRAVCLLGGTTDWRNAELYGDETVNTPGSPAYQLFGDNPKQVPDDARTASAINYVRPTSPPVLMITLQSDENRAMHLIFAETLRRAGVASALYEEKSGTGLGGRSVDESKLDQTILEFFADTLGKAPRKETISVEQEIDILTKAGLFKQARRLIEQQMALAPPEQREPYRQKLRTLATDQQEPAILKLMEVRKNKIAPLGVEGINGAAAPRILWTIREVLTDPERIGQYDVDATIPQADFDLRAVSYRLVETLNGFVLQQDWPAAERQIAEMRRQVASGSADASIIDACAKRFAELRAASGKLWPPETKPIGFATAFGQDLYGYWFSLRAGGATQRFRYIPPGKFVMGSNKEEWGRLPGEPILDDVLIKQGFWLSDTPVTQEMWEGVLGSTENHSQFRGPHRPVESVSFAHAVNFLQKLGIDARLPTEAEWEYACRAGSRYMYAGTGRLSDMAWFWDERQDASPDAVRILHELETDVTKQDRSTHDVKGKLPNAWGLYDMQGNVWQWCAGTSPDRLKDYHPARGGSWISIPQSCRAARVTWHPVEYQSWNLGLRIVIPAPPAN